MEPPDAGLAGLNGAGIADTSSLGACSRCEMGLSLPALEGTANGRLCAPSPVWPPTAGVYGGVNILADACLDGSGLSAEEASTPGLLRAGVKLE